jgi:hypothetical protein
LIAAERHIELQYRHYPTKHMTTREVLSNIDAIEQYYDDIDAAHKLSLLNNKVLQKKFSKFDDNIINGRPHHVSVWQAGAETNLGYRRA